MPTHDPHGVETFSIGETQKLWFAGFAIVPVCPQTQQGHARPAGNAAYIQTTLGLVQTGVILLYRMCLLARQMHKMPHYQQVALWLLRHIVQQSPRNRVLLLSVTRQWMVLMVHQYPWHAMHPICRQHHKSGHCMQK